ncbi:glycoside hydrolase family 5 protein, partial [Micromonas pusilla CCMP1545]
TSATSSFVAREGGRFVLDGATFHVAGANCYYLAYSSGADAGSYEHDWVKEVLDEAQSLELNVLRVWSFQDEWWQRDRALQPAPGQYNERFLVALDGLIVESARRDIRLLLCLTNYWEDYGGAIAYVNWAHAAGERRADGHSLDRQEDFFTSQLCRAWFKRFATHVLSRVNTITGVAYRDDPAIFAWELINEPRVLGDASGDILQNWIDEMSAHAKSVDANHMLTVGIEGFWGKTSPHRVGENPIDGAERMGCDFVRNFLNPNLDFASVHVWPDLWLYCDDDCKFEFMKTWIAGHLEESRDTFDKPVLLEEFGK